MSEDMRHPLSFALRTMSGLVKRKVLDEAADELDRLNNLIISTTTQASTSYSEHKRQVALLKARIEELEHAVGTRPADDA
jgi:hypothetical protein